MLRGVGRLAVSHHALNVSIQAALQLLPVLVVVLVSAQANAAFNSAIMLSGFVFALPYAVSVGLFAAARGDETEVVRRMRLTIPFGLAVSAAADIVIFPLAGPVLHIFGPQYAADGTVLLRLVVLAGIPFVIKDHFIALRRVQGRTSQALVVTAAFLVAELAAATVGALDRRRRRPRRRLALRARGRGARARVPAARRLPHGRRDARDVGAASRSRRPRSRVDRHRRRGRPATVAAPLAAREGGLVPPPDATTMAPCTEAAGPPGTCSARCCS